MSKKTGESIPYSSEWEKVFSPGGDARGVGGAVDSMEARPLGHAVHHRLMVGGYRQVVR